MKTTAQTSKRRRKGGKGLTRQRLQKLIFEENIKSMYRKKGRERKRNKYLNELETSLEKGKGTR